MEEFNYKLNRKPTPKTLLFIYKTENGKTARFVDGKGNHYDISSEFKHEHLTKWKSDKYNVFAWAERIHDKRVDENNKKRYFDHFLYRYFLIPKDILPPKPTESTGPHDFGFHRIKDELERCKAIPFLTITAEDVTGHTRQPKF